MPDPRPTLLLTRPEAQSRRFAHLFAARFGEDWPTIVAPLMETVPLMPPVPDAEALIFTSETGVSSFAHIQPARGRTAYCVGARTAKAAQEAGFETVVGPGDGSGLADLIEGLHRQGALGAGPLLHAHGAKVAFNLAKHLTAAGIETHEAIVYEQMPLGLPRNVRALLQVPIPLLVPVFSPLTADFFMLQARDAEAQLLLCPISQATADRLQGLSWARFEVAKTPDSGAILDALERQIRASGL
ncbi:uroporphyrinogen-III synthase [Albirhodobacter sp. R86504]|uniref:uroporphyrinogen-III synthase n=1 Tax=Albirhodobacter sp. R86504 TaxID=3093848 RepID=UPI0036701107